MVLETDQNLNCNKEGEIVNWIKIDKYTDRVIKEGGKIMVPKKQIPTVDWFAIVADPEGNAFGLLQPEMPQKP